MSIEPTVRRISAPDIRARKGGNPIVSLTSYHAHTAALLDKHCDVILVGDSLGMVMHGLESTIPVTLDMMILQGKAVMRGSSRALVVARYSTCCNETRRGRTRSLAMVGKLFPTLERESGASLPTANFVTQQDLGGDYTDFVNDAELRNAPDTSAWRRGLGVPVLLVTGIVFGIADRKPSIRQLYPIAELDKKPMEPTRAPTFMRLRVDARQPRIPGLDLDFRDEIMAQIYDPGDPVPKRMIAFDIDVTDEGETHGLQLRERRTFRNWRRIGSLVFNEAIASYNGDFVVHFAHPTWRDDQNDPATATRVRRRKVR